jgi:hypothetical protein
MRATGVPGGEPLHRPWTGVMRVADGRGLDVELFEFAGLGSGGDFGAALDEDPLTGDGSVVTTR